MSKKRDSLSYNLKTKIITVISVLILLSLGYVPFTISLVKNPADSSNFIFLLPLAILMTFFSVIIIINIFCSEIIYSSYENSLNTIAVREGFSFKTIDKNQLTSYKTKNDGGLFIFYQLNDEAPVKVINVPYQYKNIEAFTDFLDTFLDDERDEELEQIEEEKQNVENYESAQKKCSILNKISIALAVLLGSTLILPVPFIAVQIIFVCCAAYPVILFLIIKISKGEITDEASPSGYPTVFEGILIPITIMILFSFFHFLKITDYKKFFKIAMAFTGAFAFVMYFCTRFSFVPKDDFCVETRSNSILIVILAALLWSLPVCTEVNYLFDRKTPEVYTTKIITKEITGGRNPRHILYVSPWFSYTEEQNQLQIYKKIRVKKNVYNNIGFNNEFDIYLCKGFLNIPYYDY